MIADSLDTWKLKVALIQMNSTDDKVRNLGKAERLIERAMAFQPRVISLPENFGLMGPPTTLRAGAEDLDGPIVSMLRRSARQFGIFIIGGAFKRRVRGQERVFNTCVVVGPDGEIRALYDKIHLFDAHIAGTHYQASQTEQPGSKPVAVEIDGVHCGLTICYDVRFPELFRSLVFEQGVRIINVPAAFTLETGKDHWEVLLRARAIENQVYILAPATFGKYPPNQETYGRSMVVDPWGNILVQASDTETVVSCELDFEWQDRIRESLPVLRQLQT
jgi:deaminated glutathione amidase